MNLRVWLVGFLSLIAIDLVSSHVIAAETSKSNTAVEGATPPPLTSLDSQIEGVQDARECIKRATTKEQVQACQRTMGLKLRQKVEGHGY